MSNEWKVGERLTEQQVGETLHRESGWIRVGLMVGEGFSLHLFDSNNRFRILMLDSPYGGPGSDQHTVPVHERPFTYEITIGWGYEEILTRMLRLITHGD